MVPGGLVFPHARIQLLVMSALVSACATSPNPAAVDTVPPASASLPGQDIMAMPPESAEDASPIAEEEEAALEPEDLAQGFCIDDIYAKYLTSRYAATVGKKRSKPRYVRLGRRHRLDRSRFEALSYARDRMNGRTAPFFGALPIVVNDKVDFWVQYYKTAGRRQFMSWLVRGESVRPMVQPVLQEAGVPMEFFYLAMIESGFSNHAYSHARATGTWQFMQGTARLYGLKINHWVDERRDPVKSTLAAATYLRDLYAELGDWYLAMAAYNAGPGKVRKAIRRTGTRDFWAIAETKHLAAETKNYVPKVLAAILLATERQVHGFDVKPNPADRLPETKVVVKRPIQLHELAQKLGLPRRDLARWNPELLREITPPSTEGYELRLPEAYAARFAEIESQLAYVEVKDVQMHKIQRGETLSHLARRYKVAIKQIMAVNPGIKPSRLRPGKAIAIPIPGVVAVSKGASAGDMM